MLSGYLRLFHDNERSIAKARIAFSGFIKGDA
jgi:hypothetical protein